MTSILSITGSDNSGFTGCQQDVRIISEMGAHAMTSVTCQVTQNNKSIKSIDFFSERNVRLQVKDIVSEYHPACVKVGLVGTSCSIKAIAEEIIGCRRIVVAPAFVFTNGVQYICNSAIDAVKNYLIPIATIVVLRCKDAELMLNMKIYTDDDMKIAAKMLLDLGAQYVLLRSGHTCKGRVTALLAGPETEQFFSSYFLEGWQQHGIGGILSAAITTRLGLGDDVCTAVQNAHGFVHSRVVYSTSNDVLNLRPSAIYNSFMDLITDNYKEAHDVSFYASRLNVTTRYLSLVTRQTVFKNPKQVIADFLIEMAKQMLRNSYLSVKEIAFHLGFISNQGFCKFFKKQEGISPNEFRKSVESLS